MLFCPPVRFWFLVFALVLMVEARFIAASPDPQLTSSAPGFLFIEGEPTRVDLQLTGPSPAGRVQIELENMATGQRTSLLRGGKLPRVPAGEIKAVPYDLNLAERGLYRLHVSGKAGRSFSIDQPVALTFAPRPPNPQSPWGIFYVPPVWFAPGDDAGADRAAESLHRLGASWVRLNFWAHSLDPISIGSGPKGETVTADLRRWKNYARALRQRGIEIMGTIAQMPRALSSDPTNEQTAGDGGPAYHRVKPADYDRWDQLMENLAKEFRDEISVWEVWNEPDNQGVYWRGTPEELTELVKHTGAALRRGNPSARIAGCGFTSSPAGRFFAEAALNAGLAKELDLFTFHYSDTRADEIERWRELLARYRPTMILWNTEERSLLPIFDRQHGIERSCKFLHVAIGYEETEPLVNKDYSVRAAGLAFAVGAKLLGNARYQKTHSVPGGSLHVFTEDGTAVAVYQAEPFARFLAQTAETRLSLSISKPSKPGMLSATQLGAKTRECPLTDDSRVIIETSEPMLLFHGCESLAAEPLLPAALGRFEAEDGRFGPAWKRVAQRDTSGQYVLELSQNAPESPAPAELEIEFQVPSDDWYDVLLASPTPTNDAARSAFVWMIDDASPIPVERLPALVTGGEKAGVRILGPVRLRAGTHRFRLRVAATAAGGSRTILSVDAIAFRPTGAKRLPNGSKKG